MSRRSCRLFAGAAIGLLLGGAGAHADLALFGAYWDNVARMAAADDPQQVTKLITGGHDPNELDDNGRTGLEIAAIRGDLQIAAILIKAGAHLDLKDKLGNTALHDAVEGNRVEMVQLLLDAGAKVDPQNRDGMTPLMLAASRGSAAMVAALLAKGADPHKTDFTGRDAASWAADSHRARILDLLRRATPPR
jgi:uncharacterized protein